VSKIPEWAKEMARDLVIYPEVGEDGRPYLASDDHETIALALVAAEKREESKHAELKRLLAKAEDGAGTLKAKDSVKLRPADWHSIAAAIRQLGEPHD
jgi:hypothetical protein